MGRLDDVIRNALPVYEKPVQLVGYEISESDFDWIINRVKELQKENKRYKQALEFYAYENGNPAIDGIIARKALKGE